jgi:hypothetical protein
MTWRQDTHRTTVSIDGTYLGAWESKTGGDSDSNTVQWQQAGMAGQVSLGGAPMTANLVLSRLEDAEILAVKKWLRSRAGKGVGTVTEQVLDDEGFAYGDPDVYVCLLKRAKGSDRNSNSNTAAEFEIELEVNGTPS